MLKFPGYFEHNIQRHTFHEYKHSELYMSRRGAQRALLNTPTPITPCTAPTLTTTTTTLTTATATATCETAIARETTNLGSHRRAIQATSIQQLQPVYPIIQ